MNDLYSSVRVHRSMLAQRPERAILHAQVDQAQKDLAVAREELAAARVEFKGYGSTDQLRISVSAGFSSPHQ